MRVRLRGVSKGKAGRALPRTSLSYETGEVTLAIAETEQRPTVLGLIASGRMRPDAGTVTIDDREDPRALRRAIALVDAPDISEPEPNVATSGVVAEELMFAGRPPTPFAARRWLDRFSLGRVAGTDIGEVDPGTRVRILLELAAMREGVAGIVLVSPDRHGGSPAVWWRLAHEFADRGLAMLVISGVASRMVLDPASPDSVAEPVSRRSRT